MRLGRSHDPIDTVDLLGVCRASRPLRLIDIEIFGWLSGRLPSDQRFVEFSRTELARDLFGRSPGGADRSEIAKSLDRLATASLTFGGFDRVERRWNSVAAFEDVRLLHEVRPEKMSRAGQPLTWRATFEPWCLNQLSLGYVTFVDWQMCRSLRGLAKRLWLYACAENQAGRRRPKRRESSFVVLSPKGMATLGLDYSTQKHALAALREAIETIQGTDPRFTFELDRHGQYHRLTIRRVRDVGVDRAHAWDGIDAAESWVGSIRRPERGGPEGTRVVQPPETEPTDAELDSDDRGEADEDDADWVYSMGLDEASDADLVGSLAIVRSAWTYTLHTVDCRDLAEEVESHADGELIVAGQAGALHGWLEEHRLPWPRVCPQCRPRPLQLYWAD